MDPNYYRPTEVDLLIGDASKAKEILGWSPTYDINTLIKEMVNADMLLFKKDIHLKKRWFSTLSQQE